MPALRWRIYLGPDLSGFYVFVFVKHCQRLLKTGGEHLGDIFCRIVAQIGESSYLLRCVSRSCRMQVKTTGEGKILHRRGSHNHEAVPALVQVCFLRFIYTGLTHLRSTTSTTIMSSCLSWYRCRSWRQRNLRRSWEITRLPMQKISFSQSRKRFSTLIWLRLLHLWPHWQRSFNEDWKRWNLLLR